jgi:hypothetical protein
VDKENDLLVELTRKQIEEAPSIETHKPVTRLYEEKYHRHFSWARYWTAEGFAGTDAVTMEESEPKKKDEPIESHLHSILGTDGFHVEARDGKAGHVNGFMIDEETWTIHQLVVKSGHLPLDKELEVTIEQVDRIDFSDSKVYLNLTRQELEQDPRHHQPSEDTAVDEV